MRNQKRKQFLHPKTIPDFKRLNCYYNPPEWTEPAVCVGWSICIIFYKYKLTKKNALKLYIVCYIQYIIYI